MRNSIFYFLLVFNTIFSACKSNKEKIAEVPAFLTAKEVVRLNQLVYNDSTIEAFEKDASGYNVLFMPKAINGNYAIIVQKKGTKQFALVIRGSVIRFSNEGFQNFFLQDFNIFTIKPWNYTDSVKESYISNGTWIGFQNLLQCTDIRTGLNIKDFIVQKIPGGASIVITGHSLGGNLAYPLAGYLKKELPIDKKENLQLITFGATAAGNASFVQDLEGKFPDGERYITNLDIAPVFPDIDEISKMAKLTGLDSVLQLGNLKFNGKDNQFDVGDILDIAGDILEKTNVINNTNKYVQSQKHLRVLQYKDSVWPVAPLSVAAIFDRAYQFHKIDMYAQLLGVDPIE